MELNDTQQTALARALSYKLAAVCISELEDMRQQSLNEFVDEAAVTLVGLHEADQGAALAAACEHLAEWLTEVRPQYDDETVRGMCVNLAKRVKARLHELEAVQGAAGAVH